MLRFIEKSYSSMNGHLFAIIGIAVSGIPIYFKMNETLSIKVLFPIFIFIFFVISILFRALYLASTQINLPRIRKGINAYAPYEDFTFLALLDPYKLFTFNTVLSVFLITDGVEELIGTGRVINVQQNDKLLIGVKLVDDKDSLKKPIVQNNQEIFKNLVIKPMVEA